MSFSWAILLGVPFSFSIWTLTSWMDANCCEVSWAVVFALKNLLRGSRYRYCFCASPSTPCWTRCVVFSNIWSSTISNCSDHVAMVLRYVSRGCVADVIFSFGTSKFILQLLKFLGIATKFVNAVWYGVTYFSNTCEEWELFINWWKEWHDEWRRKEKRKFDLFSVKVW